MRVVPYLVVLAAVIAALLWTMQRLRQGHGRSLPSGDHGAPAMIAAGPDQGPGQLLLTPTQLVFTAATGRVVVVERVDIVGATTTRELPDRHTAGPVLAVRTEGDVLYFLVDDPEAWARRLTSGRGA
jgi:hypothetical protein